MVDNEPEERSKCFGIAAHPWIGKLQDSLVVVAQTEKSNGQARARQDIRDSSGG